MKKQGYVTLFLFLLSSTVGAFYYYSSKTKPFLFDSHIVDSVHLTKPNVLFEKADGYKYAQDYQKAEVEFRQLLDQPLSTVDSQYVLNQLAYIALAMNEDSAAAKYIHTLETDFPTLDKSTPSVLGDYFYNKGVLSYRNIQTQESEFFLRHALIETQKVYPNDHLHIARCQATLGVLFYEFRFAVDSAYLYLGKSCETFTKNQGLLKKWSPECLLGMAMAARSKRQYDVAAGYCDEAISLLQAQSYTDNILLARCLVNKARAVNTRINHAATLRDSQDIYKESLSYFEKAIQVCPKNSFRLQECYHDLARQYARISPKIDPKQEEHFWVIVTEMSSNPYVKEKEKGGYPLFLKGYHYFLKQKLDSSLFFMSQFYKEQSKDSLCFSPVISESNVLLSYIYETLSDKLNKPVFLDSALHYLKQNDLNYAGYSGKDLDWSDMIKPSFYRRSSLQFVSFSGDAKLFYKKYEKTGDLTSLKYAMKIAQITDALLFSGLPSKDDDVFDFFQEEAAENTYGYAIKSACALFDTTKNKTYINDVFRFGERVRSFLLYRDIPQNDLIEQPEQQLLDKIRQIESEINNLKWQKEKGGGATIPLMQKQNQRDAFYAQLKKNYPRYYQLKIEQPIPTVAEVQKSLTPHKWLVQYTFSKGVLHILYINHEKTFLYQTEWNNGNDEKLLHFCQFLNDKTYQSKVSAKEYAELGFELYQKLLPKLPPQYQASFNACQELIISPDRLLNLLPFETLVESKAASDFPTMPYLVHCFPITYAPSWKIYTLNQKNQLPQSPSIHCYTYDTTSLELPAVPYEIANIKRIFSKPVFSLGKDCSSKHLLTDTTSPADILHISLHAESDPLSKNKNQIYFAPKKQDTLYGFNILKRQYTEKLIVLSACQTAFGKIKKGEGAYTLSRIFLRAGAPRVIGSLWSINDKKTATIISHFYENIVKQHLPPVKSLQNAKTRYLKSADEYAARPCFWAGLVCVD